MIRYTRFDNASLRLPYGKEVVAQAGKRVPGTHMTDLRSQALRRTAAELLRRWLTERKIGRDPGPTLYPYEIDLVEGGRRLGICALVALEESGSGVIRPHEATVPKTVEERLSLLRATRIDLEPLVGGRKDVSGVGVVERVVTVGVRADRVLALRGADRQAELDVADRAVVLRHDQDEAG